MYILTHAPTQTQTQNTNTLLCLTGNWVYFDVSSALYHKPILIVTFLFAMNIIICSKVYIYVCCFFIICLDSKIIFLVTGGNHKPLSYHSLLINSYQYFEF